MNIPIISVITPSYNQGDFIEETIKSVLNQGGEIFIDYIIVDGGSTDGSVDIIKKYEHLLNTSSWPVICRGIQYRWVSEKDRGQANAINKGWNMAKGEILGWLNSDDILLPDALKEIADMFMKNIRATIVYGNGYYIDESGNSIMRFNTERDEGGNYIRRFDTEKFDREVFQEINYILQPTAFFRKRTLEKIGMLDETLHYCLDHDFWIRASKEFNFTHIDKDIAAARIHIKSKTMGSWVNVAREEVQLIKKHYGTVNPPVVFRYIKAVVMSILKLPVSVVTPILLILTLIEFVRLNKKLPFYPLKKWVGWAKEMRKSNKQNLDIHLLG